MNISSPQQIIIWHLIILLWAFIEGSYFLFAVTAFYITIYYFFKSNKRKKSNICKSLDNMETDVQLLQDIVNMTLLRDKRKLDFENYEDPTLSKGDPGIQIDTY